MTTLSCAICSYSAMKQGGVVQETGKDEPKVVCGLHLNSTGDELLEGEVTGSWEVLHSWGYESADSRVVDLWDQGMQRFNQAGEEGAGWKVVAMVGDVCLEVSCVPRGSRGPGPVKQPKGPAPELNNENIFEGLEWTTKIKNQNAPAGPGAAWAWAWMQDRDQIQSPLQAALEGAIAGAEGSLIIGETTYTIGGRDKNLFNWKKKGASS